ncbi:hypothetical protein [Brevibacillus agri]|uniref:hypothetical protein n=2 Tax=Brevibacillus TaxID=55080 RepID=UPI0004714271|nr:hypothetical protein [Brevibacillus agri]MDN4096245.1 hypothetical protein [Brevibacillus agri]MDR9507664.1 hypothetical protein [Brevibacillus agri]MED1825088.1 hypothetical protein [Brevibacillus agri]MED3497668.1 hypothetical protein [Brevibacillus agri]WHX30750.1 hypothetical protein QNK09_00215 [Brevibacillus agri]
MKKVLFSFASLVLGLAVINPVSAHATVEKSDNASLVEQQIKKDIGTMSIELDWRAFSVTQGGTYIGRDTFHLFGKANAGLSASKSNCDITVYIEKLSENGKVEKTIKLGKLAAPKGNTDYTDPVSVDPGNYRLKIIGNISSEGEIAVYRR